MDTGGNKAELQQRLRDALTKETDDPDKFLFEVPGVVDMNAMLEQMKEKSGSLEGKMEENSRSLTIQIEEQIKENSREDGRKF